MGTFSLGFSVSSSYQGVGGQLPLNFWELFPPESGCVGYAADDNMIVVKGTITTQTQQYLARSATDATAIKVVEFSVGAGGYNPVFPLYALDPDPEAVELAYELYRAPITAVEDVLSDGTAKSFVGRVPREAFVGGVGEIGLWAEIVYSPYSSEIGEKFLFAICHQPLNVKSYHHVASYRIVIVF